MIVATLVNHHSYVATISRPDRISRESPSLTESEVDLSRLSLEEYAENYKIGAILQLIKDSSLNSGKLIQLYIERCYKLADNDVDGVFLLDQAIDEIN